MSNPMLVTGSPRSGTTFVGRMLSASPDLYYVHEPFNPHTRARDERGRLQFERHFTYLTDANSDPYEADLRRMIEGRFDLAFALRNVRKPRQLKQVLSSRKTFSNRQQKGIKPLIKDPIALMSAGWMVPHFGLDCVVTVRHPGAFVASIDRLDWDSKPFRWALSQPLLMQEVFAPFEEELKQLEASDADVIDRAAMAWKLHHYVIASYQERFPDWVFLRHEDISMAPVDEFRALYERFGLTWTDDVERTIVEHTSSENPSAAQGQEKALRLDSRANLDNWKKRLSDEEMSRVKARVSGVAEAFYDEASWQ